MSLNRWILASEVLTDLTARGIELSVNGDALRYRAPNGSLSDRVRRVLTEYKPEIVDLLRPRPDLAIAGPVTLEVFVFNPFRVNTYLCHNGGEAIVVDPGSLTAAESRLLIDYVERNRLKLRHVVTTHGHVDHFCGAASLYACSSRELRIHAADLEPLADTRQNALLPSAFDPPVLGRSLEDGERLEFGNACWRVIHCPGHSAGSVCFHDPANRFVFTGDVLFRGAIGGKLAGADALRSMLDSIRERLFPLGDDTVVLPGHGPRTTIGAERMSLDRAELADEGAPGTRKEIVI